MGLEAAHGEGTRALSPLIEPLFALKFTGGFRVISDLIPGGNCEYCVGLGREAEGTSPPPACSPR